MTCNTSSSSKLKRQVWSLILKVKRESLFPKFNLKTGSWKLRTTSYLHSECSDGIIGLVKRNIFKKNSGRDFTGSQWSFLDYVYKLRRLCFTSPVTMKSGLIKAAQQILLPLEAIKTQDKPFFTFIPNFFDIYCLLKHQVINLDSCFQTPGESKSKINRYPKRQIISSGHCK